MRYFCEKKNNRTMKKQFITIIMAMSTLLPAFAQSNKIITIARIKKKVENIILNQNEPLRIKITNIIIH